MAISLLAYGTMFSRQLYFWKNVFFTLFQSNCFDTSYFLGVVISSDQLLFLISSFSRAVASPQQLFFQNSYLIRAKLLSSSHFLRIGSCLGQYFVWTATFLVEKLVQNKDIYRRATLLKQVLPHCINIYRTEIFLAKLLLQIRNFFRTATFWKRPIFRKSSIPH